MRGGMVLASLVSGALGCGLFTSSGLAAEKAPKISFKRTQIDSKFRSEGASVGDFNHDGRNDISAGFVYFAAPDWKMHPVIEKPQEYDPHNYSNSFCNFADDVNGDGWTDLLVVDFPASTRGGSRIRNRPAARGSVTSPRRSRTTKARLTSTSTVTDAANWSWVIRPIRRIPMA